MTGHYPNRHILLSMKINRARHSHPKHQLPKDSFKHFNRTMSEWNAHHGHVVGVPCKREREHPFHYGIIGGWKRLWSNEGEKYNIFRLNAETWTKCHVSKHLEGPCSDEPSVITSRQLGIMGYGAAIGSTFRTRALGKPPDNKAKR
jgi:hypothetical protein